MLVNLLANAVKFCDRAEGRVEVAAESRAGELRVTVADNGPGIPSDARGKIFEKFQQLPGPESPQGTGLGLAISRQIVEHFGGHIWVETAPPNSPVAGGARFVFSLPFAPPGAGALEGAAAK